MRLNLQNTQRNNQNQKRQSQQQNLHSTLMTDDNITDHMGNTDIQKEPKWKVEILRKIDLDRRNNLNIKKKQKHPLKHRHQIPTPIKNRDHNIIKLNQDEPTKQYPCTKQDSNTRPVK